MGNLFCRCAFHCECQGLAPHAGKSRTKGKSQEVKAHVCPTPNFPLQTIINFGVSQKMRDVSGVMFHLLIDERQFVLA